MPTQNSPSQRKLEQRTLEQRPLKGHFLEDSIEIGRPFRYSLSYHHPAIAEVLFPDTARSFAPYRVQKVAVFATKTTGSGLDAVSRDSAVYTLVSFETDSVQLLRVPIRTINDIDCTAQWTLTDTVFLRSKLPPALPDSLGVRSLRLATDTKLVPLQQQFNYVALAVGFVCVSVALGALYLLFGRLTRRQWRLFLLNRRHIRFLREYTRLSERISPFTAAETANQAVVMWKTYLEQLDPQPYMSLTTPELAERLQDERVETALREADQMIYGGTFTAQSQSALQVLSNVATQIYRQRQAKLLQSDGRRGDRTALSGSAEPSSLT
ncbi:hypothetical protein [Spirosoma pollinicola]|uniref:hypothetical protein n=1 Tax=Spirosoma pollinicola TaxID=2057025 RepID=UPI00197E89D5|nr:hypothetical protein [Spirosoma pollinicola]